MQRQGNHGRRSFYGKNQLCSIDHIHHERIGRFGRMFAGSDLHPLYVNPGILNKIGEKNGMMDAGSGNPLLTSSVPLGIIYLGQFIDHDITFDTSSNFDNINNPTSIDNERTARLDMDCVFGAGMENSPFLFRKTGGQHPESSYVLLTGKTNKNSGQRRNLEIHDLARNGDGVAIIGDPRNDENRVISQLQLAFIRFYNAVAEKVKTANPSMGNGEVHRQARQSCTWHYQWIVLNEFLPAMCGQVIVDDILSKGRQFYQPTSQAFIPVEFSVAAYRFGHSMIAQNMKLQASGSVNNLFSGAFGRGFEKITDTDQIIEWTEFFSVNGSSPQLAEKLDTNLASDLLALPFIPAPNNSLAGRNLRRGQSFLLPSGEAIAAKMNRSQTEISSITSHVRSLANSEGISLTSDTPLWLYILAEAEIVGRTDIGNNAPGEGLGPVGATIVAEVLIGLLELDSNSFLGSNRDWVPDLVTGGDFTMGDLLTLAATAV